MNRRNLIIAGAAVLLGLVAVYLANAWFSGAEQKQAQVAAEQKLVRIAVAQRDLDFGSQLTADNIRLVNWPEQSVPNGAFRDANQLIASNQVAIRPIAAGEPILPSRISGRPVLSENIPPDMRAISLSVDQVSGVAGFITPGDVVDVLLTRDIPGEGATGDDKMTSVVLENVQVLATDQLASEKNTDPKLVKTVTLQVTPRDAQKLVLARQIGSLSLALRNVKNQVVGPTATVTPRDLAGGGIYLAARRTAAPVAAQPVVAAPAVARSATRAAPTAPRPSGPTMSVYRGTASNIYEVQRYGRF